MLDLNQKIKIFEELIESDNSIYAEEMYISLQFQASQLSD